MDTKEILSNLNALRSRALGAGLPQRGSEEIVMYNSELKALDEAIELLKDLEED